MKRVMTIYALLLCGLLVMAAPLRAQDEGRTYTFTDRSSINIPDGWQIDANPFSRDTVSFLQNGNAIHIALTTPEIQEQLGDYANVEALLAGVVRAQGYANGVEFDAVEQGTLTDDSTVFIYTYTDGDTTRRLSVVVLESGSVMSALPVGTGVTLGLVADFILVSAPGVAIDLNASPPTPAPLPTRVPTSVAADTDSSANTDDTPISEATEAATDTATTLALPPIRIEGIFGHVFTDGTLLVFPAAWDFQESSVTRDLVIMQADTSYIYADLYRTSDRDELNLSSIIDVMAFSFTPFSPDFAFDGNAVEIVQVGDAENAVYYWRYVDDGYAGTLMAVILENGSVLVMDAFDVEPRSEREAIAFAILLDAAGNSSLMDAALAAGVN